MSVALHHPTNTHGSIQTKNLPLNESQGIVSFNDEASTIKGPKICFRSAILFWEG